MPNPLTDELSDAAKAELAAVFAEMKRRYGWMDQGRLRELRRTNQLTQGQA